MRASRRLVLAAGAGLLAFPSFAWAQADTQKRFVFFILRGAMDGLTAVPPVGDPAYAGLRRGIAIRQGLPLDQTFALHPSLQKLKLMYDAQELLPIHACATAYRDRSHFDAQNVLETGGAAPFTRDEGWLNAALGAIAPDARRELGVAVAAQPPLVLRGPCNVTSWSPSRLPQPNADTVTRLMDLYDRRDPALAAALQGAMAANAIAAGDDASDAAGGPPALARAAADFLKRPDGPVAAVLEMGGWDTHSNEGAEQGQLARNLAQLDASLDALKAELGPAWAQTVVLVATEFGRTAAVNGNGGTDHGTGAAAFLAGGAVAGGRVLADWPSLAPGALLQQRDLRPTLDLRAVIKGVLSDHLRAPGAALDRDVFPDSADVRPTQGLLRA